jgi:hypothetical protein
MSTIKASTTTTTAFGITTDTTGTLVFQTGATPTTAMTLGSDQSVTFAGTPTYSGGTANGVAYLNGSKVLTTGSALVFDGTNLGVGIASPTQRLHVYNNVNGTSFAWGNAARTGYLYQDVNGVGITNASGTGFDEGVYLDTANSNTIFYTQSTDRGRFDSSGNFMVTKTASSDNGQVGFLAYTNGSVTSTVDSTNQNSFHLYNKNATNNGYRFYVNTNGGITNFAGNNVNISDARTKDNIENAGNYLQKICAIPIHLFNYKDEPIGEQKTLGVIAQEVEVVAPELVSNVGFGDIPEDGIPLKTVYQTDLQYALMKCIQELKAELDAAKADIETLKGAA